MRLPILMLLAMSALSAGESVPFETLAWTQDTAAPGAVGLARRVQVYFLFNLDDEVAKSLYWNMRGAYGQKYPNKYQVQFVAIGANGDLPGHAENESEYWDKALDQSGSLVRAFAGDAAAAVVIVDGSGRIAEISRLGSNTDAERKTIEALMPGAAPLIDNDGLLPLDCKPALRWIRLGDLRQAFKECQRLGGDGAILTKTIGEQTTRLITADTRLLGDATVATGTRMIAMLRLARMIEEFPGTPAEPAAAKAIKQARADRRLATELTAWAALQDYFHALHKLSPRKVAETQQQWLPMITATYAGSYAAEVATMIKRASRLDR